MIIKIIQVILIVLCLGLTPSMAENSFEMKVKAVLLVKVAKNIIYPPNFTDKDRITICTIDTPSSSNALAEILKIAVRGEFVNNRSIEVVALSASEKNYSSCNIAFISESVANTEEILSKLSNSTIIICDYERLLNKGCSIMLVMDNDMKSHFVINQKKLDEMKVRLTSNIQGL